MNPIKRELKWWLNRMFFRAFRYRRIERRHLRPRYTADVAMSTSKDRIVVLMNDGKRLPGGMADRLQAIISFYSICREKNIRFALNFTFPFEIEKYLVPNTYDWRLKAGELSFNSKESTPIFTDNIGIHGEREIQWEKNYARKQLKRVCQQLHVYSSFDFVADDFSKLFHELFKPSPLLEDALNSYREFLGKNYISVSTRFMELLGDFHEPKAMTRLSRQEQDCLIDKCLRQLLKLHQENPGKRVLVTSDSQRFLNTCSALPWVYTVEGEIAHSDTADTDNHLKTFLDFWLISEAESVYQLRTDKMYGGNFSKKAALAGDRPYKLIEF